MVLLVSLLAAFRLLACSGLAHAFKRQFASRQSSRPTVKDVSSLRFEALKFAEFVQTNVDAHLANRNF